MKLAARIAMGVLAVVAVAAVGFGALYTSRIQTANSIEKLTDYDDYNLYRMQVRYDYDLDKMIANTTADNQSFIDAAVKQALPLLPVSIKAPTFGCSAFHIQETGGDHLMGRNYDFKRDTSAMLVCTAPPPPPRPWSGRDYHFYITDAAGDGCVIEYDCDDPARPMVVTPSQQVTNFFVKYKENVLPNQKNGIYGHGRERYDAMEEVLDSNAGAITPDIAWQALQAASQEPNPKDVTSNTQWSILYDNTNCTATIALRRDWGNKTEIDLRDMTGF